MLVLNVNTLDSLVNGSLGVIEDIITESDGKVKSLVIKFDVEKAGAQQRDAYPNIANKYKESNYQDYRAALAIK